MSFERASLIRFTSEAKDRSPMNKFGVHILAPQHLRQHCPTA